MSWGGCKCEHLRHRTPLLACVSFSLLSPHCKRWYIPDCGMEPGVEHSGFSFPTPPWRKMLSSSMFNFPSLWLAGSTNLPWTAKRFCVVAEVYKVGWASDRLENLQTTPVLELSEAREGDFWYSHPYLLCSCCWLAPHFESCGHQMCSDGALGRGVTSLLIGSLQVNSIHFLRGSVIRYKE